MIVEKRVNTTLIILLPWHCSVVLVRNYLIIPIKLSMVVFVEEFQNLSCKKKLKKSGY